MSKFNLKRLTLTSGIFGVIIFLGFFGWTYFMPSAEIHQKMLLEMIPGASWPLGGAFVLLGLVGSFVCGAISGFIFGGIYNMGSEDECCREEKKGK